MGRFELIRSLIIALVVLVQLQAFIPVRFGLAVQIYPFIDYPVYGESRKPDPSSRSGSG